ncbi:unnamed protein product [Pedinophyceae sp. YPF-701]|nr:unnamed protein product [Pedinophyceae sp. YPF-701]
MVDDLEANEAAVEQRAQELKRELEGEVMALGFLRSGEACAARFDADVEPALRGRRDAARALLDHVRGYLEGQVRTWRKCIDALGGLLCDVGTAQDDHRAQVAKIREKNAYVLAMTRRAFEDSDKQVEEALAQAIRDIQEGSSERDLDQLVQVALDHLNSIEGSYRDFHSNMCSIVDALPRSIDDEFRTYHLSLCGKLRVNPKVETPGDAADADKKQSGTEQGESAAEGEAAQDKPADDAKPAEGEEGAEGEDAAPAEPPPPPEVFLAEVEAADGGFWTCAQDLYDAVILGVEPRKEDSQSTLEATESAEAPAAGSLKPQQSIQKQGSLKPQQSIQKQGSLKPQQSIRKQGSLKPQPSVKPGKKGEGVPAAVTEGVAEGAAEGEGEEEAPAADEGSKWADPPTLQSGEACLAVLTIPSERVRTALVSLTCSALGDMCQFTAEVNSEVAAWARKQAEDLTEELDELLRSHRPRAGLIEEDVRQQRSVKLLAQKRSVDAHLRGMGRSILAQCARFEGAVEERRHQIDRLLRRLRQQEGALNVDMSVKSVEIRVREAQQQQGVLERALEQACLMLSTSAEEDAARLKAVNERFAAEVLVPFEEGGEFAEANIRRYKAQLEDCNTVVRLKMEAQLAKVEELQKEMAASAGAAVEQLGRVAEVHKEDLALVEALDRAINAARSRADKIFSASEEHARRITQEIQTMRKLIRVRPEDAEAKFAERTPGPKLAAEGNHGGHELAQDLVDCSNRLRVLVASRGRTLDAVRDGIDIPVNLFRPWIEGENTEPPFEDDEDQNDAESEWTQGGLSLEKLGITREELEGVTVRVRVHELIERCHEQCAPVAQAYYESKDPERAITRPKRIPRELDELNEVNNRILNDIRGRLRRHLEESLLEFRDQIISINRQLLALPGAAARALIYHDTREYIRQAQKMDSRYASRQKQLRNELEQHRLAIRPQLGEPNCQPLVDELVEEESARAETSVESMKARARNSIEALSRAGPIIRGRLALLARGLARICDGIIVPGDLREARGDDEGEEDAVAAAEATGGLKRTMTQAAAAAVQAEASHSSVGVAQPGAPAPRTRMNIKQLKRLALAQADAGSGGTGQEANERGLVRRTWELEHGSISPGAIGWGEEDVSMARPLDDDDEDDEDEEEEEEDEGNVPLQVEGLDTPVHRACIRAYVQALETLSSAFRSIVDDVRSTLSAGLREEELFRRQFNKLVNTLQRSYV